MNKTPLTVVKERFGSKDKLVEAIQALQTPELWVDRTSQAKGISRVSNAKLLKLHHALNQLKERFGSRSELINAILELDRRKGDQGLKQRLEGQPTPRLLDSYQAATRRSQRQKAASAQPAPAKKKVARSRKAQAKARAPKASG